ncbi:hypothetical protein BDF22DRAFT_652695 [Syncephalis plumigaleata]|nr:hypothetical protein BDF22DRAFT_652695 [Syncephalis plumigaleata]
MALRTTTRIMLFPVLAQAILNSRLSISDNVAFLAAGAYVKGTVEHVTPNDDTRRSKCNSNDHAYLPNNSTCNTAVGTKPGLLANKRASLLRKVTSTSNNGHPASVDSLHDSLECRLSRRLSHLPPPNKDIVNRVTALRRYSVSSTSSMAADTIADSYRGTGGHPRVSNGNTNIGVTTMLNRRDGNLAKSKDLEAFRHILWNVSRQIISKVEDI